MRRLQALKTEFLISFYSPLWLTKLYTICFNCQGFFKIYFWGILGNSLNILGFEKKFSKMAKIHIGHIGHVYDFKKYFLLTFTLDCLSCLMCLI